jgi:hypothetical protein
MPLNKPQPHSAKQNAQHTVIKPPALKPNELLQFKKQSANHSAPFSGRIN